MTIPNVKADKMRYQTNQFAYGLVLLSIVFSVVAVFTLITYDSFGLGENPTRVVPDFRIGIEIAVSIVMMLTTFLAAEKIKYYDPIWSSLGLAVLAGIHFLRISVFGDFYSGLPFYVYDQGWIPIQLLSRAFIEFGVAGLLLVTAAFVSTRNVIILRIHRKELAKNGHDAT